MCSIENITIAAGKACRGKYDQKGVQRFLANKEENIKILQQLLITRRFKTSQYFVFQIQDPKERDIYSLPFYPDRIVHYLLATHVLEPVIAKTFTADTYSCIKGKGIHPAANAVKKALRNEQETQYCLKLDIKKFYPSVDHYILKALLRRKIKDWRVLSLLNNIIDSAPGLPIGSYLSQYLANFYLTYFDHWIKEQKGVKYYFRYADDIVILSDNKEYLHNLLAEITRYLHEELNLTVKGNYQVFPVAARGIDFLGYKFYHRYILLRKSIKKNFARKIAQGANQLTVAAYMGWAKHCNSKHLVKKLIHQKAA